MDQRMTQTITCSSVLPGSISSNLRESRVNDSVNNGAVEGIVYTTYLFS
jgi:hypothetical protein